MWYPVLFQKGPGQNVVVSYDDPLPVGGNVASGATDTGNPVKVGGVASLAAPAAVLDGQRVSAWYNRQGAATTRIVDDGGFVASISNGGSDGRSVSATTGLTTVSLGMAFNGANWDRVRGDTNALITRSALGSASWRYASPTGGIVDASLIALQPAGAAGVRNFLHGVQFKNTSAVASEIVVLDAATVIWRGHASPNMTVMDGWTFDPPLRGTAASPLNVQMVTSGTATIVSAQGSTGA